MDYDSGFLSVGFASQNRADTHTVVAGALSAPTPLPVPSGVSAFGTAVAVQGNATAVVHSSGCALYVGARMLWNVSMPGLPIGSDARAVITDAVPTSVYVSSGNYLYLFRNGALRDRWTNVRAIRGLGKLGRVVYVFDDRSVYATSPAGDFSHPEGAVGTVLTRTTNSVYAIDRYERAVESLGKPPPMWVLNSEGRTFRLLPDSTEATSFPAGQTSISVYSGTVVVRVGGSLHARSLTGAQIALTEVTNAVAGDSAVYYVQGGTAKRTAV